MAAKKKREPTAAELQALQALAATYEKLKTVRASTTLALKASPFLRTEIADSRGKLSPFKLRYYQCQGIYHLLAMKRLILGDGTGLGKTIQVLGALAYLWPKEVNNKVIVVTPKSALRQWGTECLKFTKGIRPIVVAGDFEARKLAYEEFLNAPVGPDAEKVMLLLNYAILVRDWDAGSMRPLLPNGKPDIKKPVVAGFLDDVTSKIKDLVVVFDEATAFKNQNTKTWQTCRYLSDRAHRCYGLTATLLKNKLIEGFAIFKVIQPMLFSTKSSFMDDYCVVEFQPVGGGRKIPVVVGYRNLDGFRLKIDPFFLGRAKHVVSNELPTLVTKQIICELSAAEDAKYSEALTGILQLGDGEVKDYEQSKTMTSLIYCQQIVNSLAMLKFTGGDEVGNEFYQDVHTVKELSSKESMLLDVLTGELDGEKTIVYTRFASLVPRLQELLKKEGIKSTAITGKVQDTAKNPARQKAMEAFQDLDSDTKVIIITDAGSEAINLQAASAMIFFDAPWSWGNYVQLLGRPVRIGSVHQNVVIYHLVAERPAKKSKDRKTIDHYVLDLLNAKKDLVDKVLGEAAVGALDFKKDDGVKELLRLMKGKPDPRPDVASP
jgi:SNF2 family DNA or RNA helicase